MHAYYLNNLFDKKLRAAAIKLAKEKLKDKEFDGFLVSGGVSGFMGALLAHQMKKKLVVARKEGDGSHSAYKVENIAKGDRLIFLDDLISGGYTFKHCVELARDKGPFKLVGAYLYECGGFRSAKALQETYGVNL
jgi:adenine/guanine phosphoribosyltransferase-like PRPP-binding protein